MRLGDSAPLYAIAGGKIILSGQMTYMDGSNRGALYRPERKMSLNAIIVLLSIFFVLGLGYIAGRAKEFDADQVQGISYLVLQYG
jgi:hypothetical protein